MEPSVKAILTLVFSYPAIVFWLAIFSVPSLFLASLIVNFLVFGPAAPIFPSWSRLATGRSSRPLIRVGATGSAIGIVLAAVATHRFAMTTVRLGKQPRPFSSQTVLTGTVSSVVSALALLCVGWTSQHFLSSIAYFVSALIAHTCVDVMSRQRRSMGKYVNAVVAALAVIGLLISQFGGKLSQGPVGQFGTFCEIMAFVVIHLRFMIDGEIVLGGKFLPAEIRPAILGDPILSKQLCISSQGLAGDIKQSANARRLDRESSGEKEFLPSRRLKRFQS
jgi:hypothetical protein